MDQKNDGSALHNIPTLGKEGCLPQTATPNGTGMESSKSSRMGTTLSFSTQGQWDAWPGSQGPPSLGIS
eukprot:10018518-Heterocapsa_arctica.AAC.1